MVSSRRVVITGLGVITPIGLNAADFWKALEAGRGGVRPIQSFNTTNLSTQFAAEIPNFDAKSFLDKKDRKSLRVMARGIQLGVAAAQLALTEAKIDRVQLDPTVEPTPGKPRLDPTRFGIEFGSGLLPTELPELGPAAKVSGNCRPQVVDLERWGVEGLPVITPLWMLKYLPNMHACHISVLFNFQGPSNSITESDVSSLLALGEAFRILRRDQADFFLVGGSDSKLNPLSMVRQCMFGHLSRRNEAPDQASRPFDKNRDGFVVGEGGGVLAVEDHDHARRRGAPILAEIVGFGAAFDRGGDPCGLARSMAAALNQSGIGPDDIDHINAHGLGTVAADVKEARAIRQVFGDRPVPVWATKSFFGSLGAGCDLVELSASVLAFRHGIMPPGLNFTHPDPDCQIQVHHGKARPTTKPYFLKVGFTEMGQTAAVVCKRWEE